MKTITVLVLAITAFMVSCNQSSNKEVKEATQNVTAAKDALKDARADEIQAVKEKETVEWNHFKNEADSSITAMENDLKKLEAKIERSAKKDKQQLKVNYEKSKSKMETLRAKLHKRNLEFESDIKTFDKNVSKKNQSFKREFKHDMDEFGKSFKDLFKDNVE